MAGTKATVWAINEVARRDKTLSARLLKAFDRLKCAQTRGRAAEIREASAGFDAAVDAAVARAASLISETGRAVTLATRRRIAETLRGAAAGAREALVDGVLTQELPAPGFEVFRDVRPRAARTRRSR